MDGARGLDNFCMPNHIAFVEFMMLGRWSSDCWDRRSLEEEQVHTHTSTILFTYARNMFARVEPRPLTRRWLRYVFELWRFLISKNSRIFKLGVVLCWLYAGKSLSLWCFAGFCGRMFALLLCWLHSGNTCSLYHSIALWLRTGYHWISLVAPGVPRFFGSLGPRALGTRVLGRPLGPT